MWSRMAIFYISGLMCKISPSYRGGRALFGRPGFWTPGTPDHSTPSYPAGKSTRGNTCLALHQKSPRPKRIAKSREGARTGGSNPSPSAIIPHHHQVAAKLVARTAQLVDKKAKVPSRKESARPMSESPTWRLVESLTLSLNLSLVSIILKGGNYAHIQIQGLRTGSFIHQGTTYQ